MPDEAKEDAVNTTTYGLTPQEQKKRQQRNIVLALSIVGFVLIVFLVTILRLGGSIAEQPF